MNEADLIREILQTRDYLVACASAATKFESTTIAARLTDLAAFDCPVSEMSDNERRVVVIYLVAAFNCATDEQADERVRARLWNLCRQEAAIYGSSVRALRAIEGWLVD